MDVFWQESTFGAIGVTTGLGSVGLAFLGTILTLIILTVAGKFEFLTDKNQTDDDKKLPIKF